MKDKSLSDVFNGIIDNSHNELEVYCFERARDLVNEKVEKLKEELSLLKKHLRTQKQIDSYDDEVLEFKGVIKNIGEFGEKIDKIFGDFEEKEE